VALAACIDFSRAQVKKSGKWRGSYLCSSMSSGIGNHGLAYDMS
jgi:hypothetical protein